MDAIDLLILTQATNDVLCTKLDVLDLLALTQATDDVLSAQNWMLLPKQGMRQVQGMTPK